MSLWRNGGSRELGDSAADLVALLGMRGLGFFQEAGGFAGTL